LSTGAAITKNEIDLFNGVSFLWRLSLFSKTETTAHLFSYGTLQDKAVQLKVFNRELTGRSDRLPGFTQTLVEITDPAVITLSSKTHHPIVIRTDDPQHVIEGMVYEITACDLATADSYEVADYARVLVQLASGVQAWVYIGTPALAKRES
jgi:gamma-glutamylcyclotransferase (GGCT)/AIG2-like uncharacterized protein YtfP